MCIIDFLFTYMTLFNRLQLILLLILLLWNIFVMHAAVCKVVLMKGCIHICSSDKTVEKMSDEAKSAASCKCFHCFHCM